MWFIVSDPWYKRVDALIPAFIAIILAETGERSQMVAHRLGNAFADHRKIYAALILATTANLLIGAVAGVMVARVIGYDARTLFAALTLVFAGLPMLLAVKPRKPIAPKHPFLTSLIHFVPAQIAGAGPFIVGGLAARTGTIGFAFVGGFAAMIFSAALPLLLGDEWPGQLPLAALRRIAALLLIGAGLWLGLSALRLI